MFMEAWERDTGIAGSVRCPSYDHGGCLLNDLYPSSRCERTAFYTLVVFFSRISSSTFFSFFSIFSLQLGEALPPGGGRSALLRLSARFLAIGTFMCFFGYLSLTNVRQRNNSSRGWIRKRMR